MLVANRITPALTKTPMFPHRGFLKNIVTGYAITKQGDEHLVCCTPYFKLFNLKIISNESDKTNMVFYNKEQNLHVSVDIEEYSVLPNCLH